ncbi:hypothetical protein A5886_001659 [Enterococcus sp. 8G7_MSG3316]|uniref:N-acetyltransferase domain-containing protein n=1 Tax=Candidatus Enterococcus testudinis TaxID=1834191 RepID=A0A242A6K3_9ENTE|nr:GNAT family N-acetyltransferase [Enterococcus sp. 8G7_MSG3316]OTN76582.1 hypothetical protein A5886_001659 [Enterococcus sp. 8G7_MSG3316]
MIQFRQSLPEDPQEVLSLYAEVGWTAYTKEPDRLLQGLAGSEVTAAYDQDYLVGLVRAVTDGQTILYIQDLLVRPSYQRQKIGQRLLEQMIVQYPHIRQKLLLTDDQEKTKTFYHACGFKEVKETGGVAFMYGK